MTTLVEMLHSMHHTSSFAVGSWNFQPLVGVRVPQSFVGLKNAFATCYMNSIFQQFAMLPALARSVLSVDDMIEERHLEKQRLAGVREPAHSLFYQTQLVLGHLLDSKLEYYIPEVCQE